MANDEPVPLTLRGYERACLQEALRLTRGDPRKVAGLLGEPHPSPIYRKLASHGLGDVSLCAHGRARWGYADKMQFLETCAACLSGEVEVRIENRYK